MGQSIMKEIVHAVIILILLIVDLYVMVTAELAVALVAFVIGLLFIFHYVFVFQDKIHTKKD